MMKYWKLGILIIIALVAIGCKKSDEIIDKLTQFKFGTEYNISVPSTPLASLPINILTPEIATHSEEAFNANKTRADLVQHIELTQLDLDVLSPDDGTLSFLKSVDIYARAEGLPEVRVAFKDNVPDDVGNLLLLDVTGVDLTEYFKKDKYVLRINVTTDEPVTEDYEIKAHAEFFVDAKLAGQ